MLTFVLLAGLAIYIAGAFAALFAPSFGALLLMRFVQGVGAASTRVVATAVVRDRFRGAAMASVMSLVMMVFMIMPILAPNLGALVLAFGDWHALGLVMALIGIIAFVWAGLRLPETLAELTSVTNGDGTVLAGSTYTLLPRSGAPSRPTQMV